MPQREGRPKPTAVRRIAIVGTGVIGAGWTAHFLAKGYDAVSPVTPEVEVDDRQNKPDDGGNQ